MVALSNSPRSETPILLEARKAFALGLQFMRKDGTAVPLTGATVKFVMAQPARRGGAVLLTVNAVHLDDELGLAQLNLQGDDLDLSPGLYPYVVTLTTALSYSTVILKGEVEILANADPTLPSDYVGINPSTNLAAYVENGMLVQVEVASVDGLALVVNGLIDSFTGEVDATLASFNADMTNLYNQTTIVRNEAQAAATAAAASAAQAQATADAFDTDVTEVVADVRLTELTGGTRGLLAFYKALQSVKTAPVRVVFLGSSTTQGLNATTQANRYVDRVTARLQQAYPAGAAELVGAVALGTALPSQPGVQGINGGATNGGVPSIVYCNNYATGTALTNIRTANPDLVVHMIGSNDSIFPPTGLSAAFVKTNVAAAIDAIDASRKPTSHLLIRTYRRDTADQALWDAYLDAFRELALERSNVAVIDLSEIYESYAHMGADPLDLIDDGTHQTDVGHAMMADLISKGLGLGTGPLSSVSQAEAEAGAATLDRAWSSQRVRQAANAAIAAWVGSAPSALDTLNELAAALGNDANFAATVTTSLSNKADKVGGLVPSAQLGAGTADATTYLAGDRNWTVMPTQISQAEAEAGTATTSRFFTAQRTRQAINATLSQYNVKLHYGAVGNGVVDDTAAIQAALDAAKAAGGGQVYLPRGTYKTTATLVMDGANVEIVGDGLSTLISYTGNGIALQLGSKTSGAAVTGQRLRAFRLNGSAGTGTVGIQISGVQFSRFDSIRVENFTSVGAIGVKFDTQSVGASYVPSTNNVWSGGYITNCYHGLKMTKDPANPNTWGANNTQFFGLRVGSFTGIGIDNDFGECNSYYGCDASTGVNGATGVRINDAVCAFFTIRADASSGVGNTNIGIKITTTGTDYLVLNPTGNGPTTRISKDSSATTGLVLRNGFTTWVGAVDFDRMPTVNGVAIGGGGATNLDGLSDVVITAAATRDVLRYNGTNWIDDVLDGGDIQTGQVAVARLGTGSPTASTVLKGDGSWGTVAPNVTQAEAEAGTLTANRMWTPQMVKFAVQAYANDAPGHRTTLLWNGTTGWVDPKTGSVAASRPSARTDIYFDLIGAPVAQADPWTLLIGDAREDKD